MTMCSRLSGIVSLRDGSIECGFSDPRPRYFSLLGQRKVPKRKATPSRESPCAPRFRQGTAEGRSIALCRRAASVPRPFGPLLPKAPVLGAAAGDSRSRATAPRRQGCRSFRSCSSNPVQSRRAPELSTGSACRGDSGMNRGDRGAGAPSVAPRRKRGAQDQATVGPPFLWFVSFGGAKEMNSAVGPKTHTQTAIAQRFLIF